MYTKTLSVAVAVIAAICHLSSSAPVVEEGINTSQTPPTSSPPKITVDMFSCPSQNLGGGIILGSAGCDVCLPQDMSGDSGVILTCQSQPQAHLETSCDWTQEGNEIKNPDIEVSHSDSHSTLIINGNIQSYADQTFSCTCSNADGSDVKDTKFYKGDC